MSDDGGYIPRVVRILLEPEIWHPGCFLLNKKLVLLAEEGLTIL